jgi:hypothetical protein
MEIFVKCGYLSDMSEWDLKNFDEEFGYEAEDLLMKTEAKEYLIFEVTDEG